ncbi:MAG TPA: ABC transporter permease [Acidimicrobiales bacterium]|nr:ABC transporter permease [Acidimicrobiales bacterium]
MRFVVRRLGFFIVTLWAAVTLNFLLPRLMPGNPALAMMAQYKGHISGQALKALEVAFGVDTHQSWLSAYFHYFGDIFTGHFGVSIVFQMRSVSYEVLQALPWTLGLVGVTTVMAFMVGTLVGLAAGWKRGSKLDSVLPPVFVVTSAFPYFWVGLVAVWVFGYKLGWLPESGGYSANDQVGLDWHFIGDMLEHSVLPAFTLLVTTIGGWILTMRNTVITVLAEDYVRMARAKGLKPWTVMWGYAGRNAVLPNLTGFAMSLGFVVSGAILVEYVFNYPGLGWMLLDAVNSEDYALMQALFLLITVAVLLAILASDVLTAVLDPRTRDLR